LLPVLFFATSAAQAGLFSITNRQYGLAPPEQLDLLFDELEAQVNANIPDADPSTYTRGVANSTILAGAGLGADYVTPFTLGLFGGNFGAGADLGGNSLSSVMNGTVSPTQIAGFGFQGSLLLGFNAGSLGAGKNMGPIDLTRLKLFAAFYRKGFTNSDFEASFTSWSLKGQYKLVPAASASVLTWGGVDITSGLQYSGLHALISKSLSESFATTINAPGNPQVTATFDGTMNLGADLALWNIPIEASSSVRVLSVFGLYGGLGLDMSLGSANNITNLSGPVTVTDNSGSLGNISGEASLPLDSSSGPSISSLRYFIGGQLEAGVVALSLQFNGSLTNGTLGASLGAKAFW